MNLCKDREYCGGCTYQGVPYEEQLANKFGEVKGLLEAKQIQVGRMLPIEPAPSVYAYRNKMEYTFGDMEKDGPMTLGMHRKKHFMSIITVDECQLVHPDFNSVLRAVLTFAREHGYTKYHKKRHTGMMRNLVLRRGVHTNEMLINIVTSSEGELDEAGFVQMLLGLPLQHEIVGILRTINDRLADAVYCDELRVLHGRDYYNEEVLGLRFHVGPFSFFQTNVEAVENLYSYAVGLIDDFADKKAFDLFCGTGTISQVLAHSASEVIGVEIVEEAVEGARRTAAMNGLDNCRFIAGDVFEVLSSLPDQPDVIVVDPPRAGISVDALDWIISYGVRQIVYISCNPKSLAQNLYQLQLNGYRVESVKPFDNFPGTKHVETVCLLSKGEISSKNVRIEFPMEEMDMSGFQFGATYEEIQNWVQKEYGFKVPTLYIAQIKRKCGLDIRDHYNISKKDDQIIPQCPAEKEEAIMAALRHFHMIS